MGIFKKIAGILGLGRDDDVHAANGEHVDPDNGSEESDQVDVEPIPGRRKGFSVAVKVAVEWSSLGPVIVPCSSNGGVQGFKWYANRLKMDEEGDVADEFLDEISPVLPPCTEDQQTVQRPALRFQVRYTARPAKVRKQVLTHDGKLLQCVASQGKLQWV